MLHQHGFQNTVAIMGTAFNEGLIPLLTNVTSNIFLALIMIKLVKKRLKELMRCFYAIKFYANELI